MEPAPKPIAILNDREVCAATGSAPSQKSTAAFCKRKVCAGVSAPHAQKAI